MYTEKELSDHGYIDATLDILNSRNDDGALVARIEDKLERYLLDPRREKDHLMYGCKLQQIRALSQPTAPWTYGK